MLFLINDIYTNGFLPFILDICSLASIFFGIMVIITKNPVFAILYLIVLFGSISGYLISIGSVFIGIAYLLVYVGAVSILFLFILMLIDVRVSELYSGTSNNLPLAFIIGLSFIHPVYQLLPKSNSTDNSVISFSMDMYHNFVDAYISLVREFSYVTSVLWDGNLAETTHISSIGSIMFTSYAIWIIITSLILLLAMVGAIVITIKQNNSSYDSRVLDSQFIIQLGLKSMHYIQPAFVLFILSSSSSNILDHITSCDSISSLLDNILSAGWDIIIEITEEIEVISEPNSGQPLGEGPIIVHIPVQPITPPSTPTP